MSNLVEFAKHELSLIKSDADGQEMQNAMNKHIIHMVEEFSKEGHSGFSASYAIAMLKKLLNYEPLSPLTGEDDEWMDVSSYGSGNTVWQNKRCYHVFKDADGRAYNSTGIVFEDEDGSRYTNSKSRVYIEFPYTPTVQYVKRNSELSMMVEGL